MARRRQIQPANLEVDEEQDKFTASTPQSSSTRPTPASHSQENNISSQIRIWHILVTDYSARHLTRESDRLIALEGLVSIFRGVRKDQYYAGLWGRTLREDIMWRAVDTEVRLAHLCDCMPQKSYRFSDLRPRRQPDESEARQAVAPSWSWASADQGIMSAKPSPTAHTLEYFFRPLGVVLDDDTAVVNVQGRLALEGVLRPIGLGASSLHNELPRREFYGSIYSPSDPSKEAIGSWVPGRRTSTSGVAVCVPLLMIPRVVNDGSWDHDMVGIHCLVLVPTENCRLRNKASKLLEFRRVGFGSFSAEHRAFFGLGDSQRMKDDRPWDVRVKEWTRKPVVMDII